MPSAYGSSEQQLPKRIYINGLQTITQKYGNYRTITGPFGGTPIDAGEKLTATVNSANSWTFPDNSIARAYGDPNQVDTLVMHSATISFSSENLSLEDLPADGFCEVQYIITTPSLPGARGLFGIGQDVGAFRQSSFQVNIPQLDRARVFQSSTNTNLPIILSDGDPIQVIAPATGPKEGEPIFPVTRLNYLALGANGDFGEGTSSITIQIKILLANGRYLTSPIQRITINPSSVVNDMSPQGVNLIDTITNLTYAYGTGGVGPYLTPIEPIPAEERLVATFNAANSYTAEPDSLAYAYDNGAEDLPQILNIWTPTLDTTPLNIADYPSEELTYEYQFRWEAYPSEVEGILWEGETGMASPVEVVAGKFVQTYSRQYEGPTSDLIDEVETWPSIGYESIPFDPESIWEAVRHYNDNGPPGYTFEFIVRILQVDGVTFTTSTPVTITIPQSAVRNYIPS